MRWAKWLTHLLFASMLLSATLAHAQEAPVATTNPTSETAASPPPGKPEPAADNEDDANPTWFGMGFESRQDRFRREMGIPTGGASGGRGGGGSGGGGNGFGH